MGPREAASASADAIHASGSASALQARVRAQPAAPLVQATGISRSAGISAGNFPPQTTIAYVATIDTAVPALLTPFADQLGDTEVIRVYNAGYGSGYAKRTAWNCDQSLLFLSRGGRLLDGTTYADLGQRSIPGSFNWSRTEPAIAYGYQNNNNTLRKLNMVTNTNTAEFTFTGYTSVNLGGGEGNLSNDGRYAALKGQKTNGTWWIIRYDFQTQTYTERQFTPSSYDDPTMSPLGTYVAVSHSPGSLGQSTRGLWLWLYDANSPSLTPVRQIWYDGSHFDLGLDVNGNEVAVSVSDNTGNGEVAMWRLSTGVRTLLLPRTTAYWYGHVSCRNHNRPGWAYLSAYKDTGRTTALGFDEIVAVKLDPNVTPQQAPVERWGKTHHTAYGQTIDTEENYERSPMAVPSPDGRRVLFTSEWLKGEFASYYAFVIGMNV